MSGQEVFMRGLYELCTVQRRPLCLKYLAVTQVTNVGLLITLLVIYITISIIWSLITYPGGFIVASWNGRPQQSKKSSEPGMTKDKFANLIDCNCICNVMHRSTWRWPSRRRTRSTEVAKRRPKSILQWMEVHPWFEAPNHGRLWTHRLFRDSNINQSMVELGEYKIFGDSAYRGGNHSHCASYGTGLVFNSQMKSVRI